MVAGFLEDQQEIAWESAKNPLRCYFPLLNNLKSTVDSLLVVTDNKEVQALLGEHATRDKDISPTVDFTFLDEVETGEALTKLLEEYASKTREILVIHGTNEAQIIPRCSVPCKGLWPVVESFLHNNPMWQLRVRHFENRGLVILERVKSPKKSLEEKPIVVVIPSYNNSQYFIANLESIFGQSYSNFRVIYIDDASPDGTGNLVESYLNERGYKNKVTLIKNRTRLGGMENLYYAIHSCKDDEVVVNVDGDDQLAHSNVLQKINDIYKNPDIWMSYGGLKAFVPIEQKPPRGNYLSPTYGFSGSDRINRYFATTSPRTFYAKLFKLVKQEDLLYKGIHLPLKRNFFPSASDIAFMLPMGEMAQDHQMHYEEGPLYLYNNFTLLNDFRTDPTLQWECDQLVRRLTPYQPIKDLFSTELKKRPWQRGILNLTNYYPLRGGIETGLVNFAHNFAQRGIYNYTLLQNCPSWVATESSYLARQNIYHKLLSYDNANSVPSEVDICKVCNDEQISVIICNRLANIAPSLLAKKNNANMQNTKIVYVEHSPNFPKDYDLLNQLDGIVLVNPVSANEVKILQAKGVLKCPSAHIPIFYDEGTFLEFKPTKTKVDFFKEKFAINIEANAQIIVMVGTFWEPKNHRLLIKAINLLKKSYTAAYIVFAGGPPGGLHSKSWEYCRRLVRMMRLENRVFFLNEIDKSSIVELLHHAHIHVLTSSNESWGVAHIEAALQHKPFVGSEGVGVMPIIGDGVTCQEEQRGIAFENNNSQSLANVLAYLLDYPDVRKQMGKNAHDFVRNNFSNEALFQRWMNFFNEIGENCGDETEACENLSRF